MQKVSKYGIIESKSMTCANAMKFGSLTRRPGEYSFDRADALVSFARENDIAIHGYLYSPVA